MSAGTSIAGHPQRLQGPYRVASPRRCWSTSKLTSLTRNARWRPQHWPLQSRSLVDHNEIHIIQAVAAVIHRWKRAVGIERQIDPCRRPPLRRHHIDQARALMAHCCRFSSRLSVLPLENDRNGRTASGVSVTSGGDPDDGPTKPPQFAAVGRAHLASGKQVLLTHRSWVRFPGLIAPYLLFFTMDLYI